MSRIELDGIRLRRPDDRDVDDLLALKNDSESTAMLVGSSDGYARSDIMRWVEFHATAKDEEMFVVADAESDRCLGHAALYGIDDGTRSAEFGILLGRESWGSGIGRRCTEALIDVGFDRRGLHRIWLEVLDSNERARRLYDSLGFVLEGTLRDARRKSGRFVDVHLMGLLDDEWRARRGG